MTITSLTDLDTQLAGPDAETVRTNLLVTLKAGEDRWKQQLSLIAVSSPEFSKVRALVKAYQAAIALLSPPTH